MLLNIKEQKQFNINALFKKVIIITSLLLLVFNLNFGSYEKAKASGFSFADSPGYADEMYSAIVTGALTIGAAGAHANEFVVDNAKALYEGAKSAYNTLAPEAKASFLESLNAAGDRIVIAGDWITHALDSLKADPVINPPTTIDPNLNLAVKQNSVVSYQLNTGYSIKISGREGFETVTYEAPSTVNFTLTAVSVGGTENMRFNSCVTGFITICGTLYEMPTSQYESFASTFNSASTFSEHVAFANSMGLTLSDLTLGGNLVIPQESIYNQLDKWLRERDIPEGKLDNLRIPQTIPMTLDGKMLTWNDSIGGLTLDGIPYTGDVTWRTTTDAGIVLPMPQATTLTGTLDVPAGTSVIPIPSGTIVNPTNTDVIVTPDGRVIPIDNVKWTTPDITWEVVNGVAVPTIKTVTGTVINIATGDIVTDIDITVPYEPKPPEKDPDKPPEMGEPKPPNPLLVGLLMALLDLIRACIMYLMRLFKYLVSLPLVASTPIPLESFQWFREATILGIQPYNLVITLAITFASLALFNTIRKMMNSA